MKTDQALIKILSTIQNFNGSWLWFADEQVDPSLVQQLAFSDSHMSSTSPSKVLNNSQIIPSPQPHRLILSNRYWPKELSIESLPWQWQFNDFTPEINSNSKFDRAFFRIAKERPLSHFVINQAFKYLNKGGELWLTGDKNEGIKTYFKQAQKLFGAGKIEKIQADTHLATIIKQSETANPTKLNDQDYLTLRTVNQVSEQNKSKTFFSKPGVFGWNKIDQGSQLLIESCSSFLSALDTQNMDFLDLGCGYGYLLINAKTWNFRHYYATDNNAGALQCCIKNAGYHNLSAEITPTHIGDRLTQEFDIIFCNPPFHQGFSTKHSITQAFVSAMNRLLKPSGSAIVVCNSFVAIEKIANNLFSKWEYLNQTPSFKVLLLSKPMKNLKTT